jgi:N-acyl-D-aspartate/D-glutamate deacylase
MTSYPASLLGLAGRGTIEPGSHADLVVFDETGVRDRADWNDPRRESERVDWVLINGVAVVENGRYRGGLHGAVLRAP